jgi:glycerate kinase
MKIIVAPNAFKGSLSAKDAAHVMAEAILSVDKNIQVVEVPFSDGGDGLLEVLTDIFAGEVVKVEVTGPLGKKVMSKLCYVKDRLLAAIEMAKASGLVLLDKSERDPTKTTTYGTGELIKKALDLGAKKIIIGIGGSATNDGGIGMASALGVRFLDQKGQQVYPCGGNLIKIRDIDISGLDKRIKDVEIDVVCDVDNPLLGENGAARIYAPQKGATPDQVEELEQGLANLAEIIKKRLNIDVTTISGGGAAGGLGAGLYAFLGARLKKGIEVMKELTHLEEKVNQADLVITGEGKLDDQIFFGKGPFGVADTAKKYSVPCIALAGSIDANLDKLEEIGIVSYFSICPGPIKLEDAMENAREYLKNTVIQVVRLYKTCFFKFNKRLERK